MLSARLQAIGGARTFTSQDSQPYRLLTNDADVSSSLPKNRKAGFPRYGFKAGISDGPSCRLRVLRVVQLASVLRTPRCLLTPYPQSKLRGAVRWHTSVQATLAALPQGPSLRSELYCLGPSSLNRPHPSHSPAQHDFVAERLIRTALAVSLLGPRRPASGSELSLIVLYRPVALCDPGMSLGCLHPVPSPTTLAYRPLGRVSALPTSPTLRFSWGRRFRGFTTVRSRYDLPICLPSCRS
jgi:hypothetical protein